MCHLSKNKVLKMCDTKRLTHPKLFSGPTGNDDACGHEQHSWITSFLRLFCRRIRKEWFANTDKILVKETSPPLFLSGVRVKISNISSVGGNHNSCLQLHCVTSLPSLEHRKNSIYIVKILW